MTPVDAKAMAIAEQVAAELRRGYDADALLGHLIPILLAMAESQFGRAAVIERLEETLAAMRREDA